MESGLSPMDITQQAFDALSTRARPLRVYGCELARGLPHRWLTMAELRQVLLAPTTPAAVRDAAWRRLLRRCRARHGDRANEWSTVVVGLALPMLRGVGRELGRLWDGDPHELDAELVTGFLVAAHRLDLRPGGVVCRLRWAAYRAGKRLLRQQQQEQVARRSGFESSVPHPPWGHPDLVLARAVVAGVLTAAEADLIATTRLDGVDLGTIATALGVRYMTVAQRRYRAERRLVEAIWAGDLAEDTNPTPLQPVTYRYQPSGRGGLSRTGLPGGLQQRGRRSATRRPAPRTRPPRSAGPARGPRRGRHSDRPDRSERGAQ